jgi:hypothetical protein
LPDAYYQHFQCNQEGAILTQILQIINAFTDDELDSISDDSIINLLDPNIIQQHHITQEINNK